MGCMAFAGCHPAPGDDAKHYRYAVLALEPAIPRHVGIIMDGNGRWARRRGHPASFGHRAGVRAIKRVLDACEKLGVNVLSIYAFSTENWSRPRAEVRALMRLFHETMPVSYTHLTLPTICSV